MNGYKVIGDLELQESPKDGDYLIIGKDELHKIPFDYLVKRVGAPLVAKTVAEMIDTTRIYVYTGNESGYKSGNWYYYDGSTWLSGGTYSSQALETDTSLTQAGKAADAGATGKAIAEKANGTGIYFSINENGGLRISRDKQEE